MKFDDLASVAKTADKGVVPVLAKRVGFIYIVLLPMVVLLLYPPVFGFMGWGLAGGIAGLFATMTLYFTIFEIKFLITGV